MTIITHPGPDEKNWGLSCMLQPNLLYLESMRHVHTLLISWFNTNGFSPSSTDACRNWNTPSCFHRDNFFLCVCKATILGHSSIPAFIYLHDFPFCVRVPTSSNAHLFSNLPSPVVVDVFIHFSCFDEPVVLWFRLSPLYFSLFLLKSLTLVMLALPNFFSCCAFHPTPFRHSLSYLNCYSLSSA